MHIPLLADLVVILTLSVAVIWIFDRIKFPAILGFLITGIICGPYLLSLVKNVHDVELLAEIGVILLLFTIGLEFSIKELLKIKRFVILGGLIQISLTIIIVYFISIYTGFSESESIFIGFLISLSSTAIVLKLLQAGQEMDTPHGKVILAILIFQDIIVVPMMLIVPILSGDSANLAGEISFLILKGLVIIVAVYLVSHFIMPKLLYEITKTKNKELFLLSIIVVCFLIGWATSSIGLSLSLGAFLAGLIISESEYSHQAIGNIIPFKVIFESFFFVSIGMLLDINFVIQNFPVILLITCLVFILKFFTGWISAFVLKVASRTMVLTGLMLAQVGEFSFILSKIGLSENLISNETYQYFLSVTIITMAITPFVYKFGHKITHTVLKTSLNKKFESYITSKNFSDPAISGKKTYKNHIIVIGYGLNGRNVVKAANYALLPYVIIETNPEVVREELKNNRPIIFGDAYNEDVLISAGVKTGKIAVVAISDPLGTRRVVTNLRLLNENLFIIVRTKYVQEIETLRKLGADDVVSEEFETSIEIFAHVLNRYMIPINDIEQFINVIRSDGYEVLRGFSEYGGKLTLLESEFSNVEVTPLKIKPGNLLTDKSLAELDLRNNYSITLLAIKRKDKIINNPPSNTIIEEGDIVYIFGEKDKIIRFRQIIH